MLIPITRKKFEELVPLTATANQYRYYWGNFSDILRRVLISVAGVITVALLSYFAGERFQIVLAFLGSATGLYWLWYPVYQATRRNLECRKYKYSGFLRGEVVDIFVTEALVGKEETVNKQGELVIIENRERRINLEVGDDTGFVTTIQAPLQKVHRSIRRGDRAELLVMSNRPDLSRIMQVSDVYVSDADLWVSDYPYLRRDAFLEVNRRLVQEGSWDDRDSQWQDPNADRYSPDRYSPDRGSPDRYPTDRYPVDRPNRPEPRRLPERRRSRDPEN